MAAIRARSVTSYASLSLPLYMFDPSFPAAVPPAAYSPARATAGRWSVCLGAVQLGGLVRFDLVYREPVDLLPHKVTSDHDDPLRSAQARYRVRGTDARRIGPRASHDVQQFRPEL